MPRSEEKRQVELYPHWASAIEWDG